MVHMEIARNKNGSPCMLLANMANRHGLIAGATGTGKSVTLRKMAESFSQNGVPVFLVDVKGDFSGMARAGDPTGKIGKRAETFNLSKDYFSAFPVRFWDVYKEEGMPFRIKLSSMGPLLLSRLLNLNANQQGLLNLVFKVADDKGWLLIDSKDLRALLAHVLEHAQDYQSQYGNVSKASVGAIQRQLLELEQAEGGYLFGEPALALEDLMSKRGQNGMINILAGARLMRSPQVFSAVLLWLLGSLFSDLPEVGDLEKPKLVLFLDEAHLLFDKAESTLLKEIEQVVRLIRSKGVGVYFASQTPLDLPEVVLGQLGNRIQHALRAFTPKDQKVVKAAAQTFRVNRDLDVEKAISSLAVGEALVSFLDEKGVPLPVEEAYILPPGSDLMPLSGEEKAQIWHQDPLYTKYGEEKDSYSAYEALQQQAKESVQEAETTTAKFKKINSPLNNGPKREGMITGFLRGILGLRKNRNQSVGYDLSNQMGKNLGKKITRTLLGAIKKRQ